MGTWLRFGLIVVTFSLMFTLLQLGQGSESHWTIPVERLLAQLANLASPSAASPSAHTQPERSPGDRASNTTEVGEGHKALTQLASVKLPSEVTQTQVPRNKFHDAEIRPAGANADDGAVTARPPDQFDLIVRNRDIHYVFNLLNSTGRIKIVALPSVKGTITVTLYDTTVEKALDAILKTHGYLSRVDGDYTLVYSQEDLQVLDPQSGKIEVFTYKPRYIAANDLIQVLTPHLTEKGKISSTKANQIGIATNADNAGGDSLAVDDAIVVQDNRANIDRIQKIIQEIDVKPEQVLIEAVLLSVQLDDDHHLGVNFALLDTRQQHLAVSGNGAVLNASTGFPPANLITGGGRVQGAFATNEHVLKYGVIDGNFTAFFNLLETIGHTTVVASPKVLALNKQRAEIIVGSQLGYRTVTTTETAAVENVQFLDVGTQLRMRPFVQQDGYIRMELHPEKSSGKVNETTGLPEKDTTQVTTNLTVRSGETIVIGGLIQEQQQRSVQQIPFFGSLPWVGRLFRDETTTINRHEIIVLITPTIINDDDEYCRAQDEVERYAMRRDGLERSFPCCTRPALARKFFQRACALRDGGKIDLAVEMLDASLQFDPAYEPALTLRKQLQVAAPAHTEMQIEPNTPLLLSPITTHQPQASAREHPRR